MTKNNVILTVLLSALCVFVVSGCKTLRGQGSVEDYNADPLTVAVPAKLTPEEVQSVMTRALTGRSWTVISSTPNEVIGELDHRGFQAKAILKYNGSEIKILSDSTYYARNREVWQPAVPYGWLQNLQDDLGPMLSNETY